MLMNPQYSPAYYTEMYRGPGHSYHPSLSSHQSSFNESAVVSQELQNFVFPMSLLSAVTPDQDLSVLQVIQLSVLFC